VGSGGRRSGKIATALAADEQRREAVAADLIVRGIDLDRLQVRQIGPAVRALLTDPCTLTAQAAGGDGWSRTDHLLALVVDELRIANWQRTGRRRGRPKPISPLATAKRQQRIGRTTRSPAEVLAVLRRVGPQPA